MRKRRDKSWNDLTAEERGPFWRAAQRAIDCLTYGIVEDSLKDEIAVDDFLLKLINEKGIINDVAKVIYLTSIDVCAERVQRLEGEIERLNRSYTSLRESLKTRGRTR